MVFLGLLIVNVTFIAYQGDMSHYLRVREFLKATAEECACGAAQYYDTEAFSRGAMVINEEEAEKYVAYITQKAEQVLAGGSGGTLAYEMNIEGQGGPGGGEPSGSPAVVVKLTLTTADLFRLPFLKAEQVARAAKYELVGTGGE